MHGIRQAETSVPSRSTKLEMPNANRPLGSTKIFIFGVQKNIRKIFLRFFCTQIFHKHTEKLLSTSTGRMACNLSIFSSFAIILCRALSPIQTNFLLGSSHQTPHSSYVKHTYTELTKYSPSSLNLNSSKAIPYDFSFMRMRR